MDAFPFWRKLKSIAQAAAQKRSIKSAVRGGVIGALISPTVSFRLLPVHYCTFR